MPVICQSPGLQQLHQALDLEANNADDVSNTSGSCHHPPKKRASERAGGTFCSPADSTTCHSGLHCSAPVQYATLVLLSGLASVHSVTPQGIAMPSWHLCPISYHELLLKRLVASEEVFFYNNDS